MNACFMGLDYIGLPTAIIAAKHGIHVTGVDINLAVTPYLKTGVPYVIKLTQKHRILFAIRTRDAT